MVTITFKTDDHPEANGREAQSGERQYDLFFTLEDGREIHILMGMKGMRALRDIVLEELIDDDQAQGN